MVEPQPSKLMTRVRFPSPAPQIDPLEGAFGGLKNAGPFGSVVEHSLGKGEVAGPIPAKGTSFLRRVTPGGSQDIAVWLFAIR